jgi:hypothetical protein
MLRRLGKSGGLPRPSPIERTLERRHAAGDSHLRGGEWNGAQGRDRTTDTVIFSHVLYQLSYLGASGRRAESAAYSGSSLLSSLSSAGGPGTL